MLVDRCFEKAFGKNFLKDEALQQEEEDKDYVYHFPLEEPKGSITENFDNQLTELADDLITGKYYEDERMKKLAMLQGVKKDKRKMKHHKSKTVKNLKQKQMPKIQQKADVEDQITHKPKILQKMKTQARLVPKPGEEEEPYYVEQDELNEYYI